MNNDREIIEAEFEDLVDAANEGYDIGGEA